MGKKTVLAVWFAAPLLAIAAYGIRLGAVLNPYFLSVALGLAAYTWFCGLLVLNSKPGYILRALGEEGLTVLMARTPLLILILSIFHGILKTGLLIRPSAEALPAGFLASMGQTLKRGLVLGMPTKENVLGAILVVLFSFFAAIGLVYLRKKAGPATPLGRMRAGLFTAQGWTSWGSLFLYLGTFSASVLTLWHILSASSTSISANPLGAIILLVELGFGLFSWLGAKIREGWKAPKPSSAKGRLGPRA